MPDALRDREFVDQLSPQRQIRLRVPRDRDDVPSLPVEAGAITALPSRIRRASGRAGGVTKQKRRKKGNRREVERQGPSVGLGGRSASATTSFALDARGIWLALALVALVVLVYAPVRHYGFVDLDDPQYVSENPFVAGGLTWSGVKWAFTSIHASYWLPLIWLSHMVDVQLYGLNAGGHHVTNVILHAANTILLFALLNRITGAVGRSAFVAA